MKHTLSIVKYFFKPDKSLVCNTIPQSWERFSCVLNKNADGKISQATLANLGDASIMIDSHLKGLLPEAQLEVECIFKKLKTVEDTTHRSKGALSIQPKLLKKLEKADNKTYTSIEQALNGIGDGIGSRVITKSLDRLSPKQINEMVETMQYKGKPLDTKQKKLLLDYINDPSYSENETEAFLLFREFAQPLIEKRSAEVVDQLTLSILKSRVNKGEITIEELAKNGFSKTFLQRLQTENILPLEVTEINNYSGLHGLPEFSDKQILELYKALNTGKKTKVPIFSTGAELIECRYQDSDVAKKMLEATSNKKAVKIKKEFDKEMQDLTNKAIKASGYRTAQMNVVHKNGALGEIQFRGAKTNEFGEYEHIAYDLRQGKNTLGELFDEYKKAVSKLTDKEYARYNEYLEQWYNYYNRLELGLPAVKPKLPKGFNKVLSKESLESLYNENHRIEKTMSANFKRYIA